MSEYTTPSVAEMYRKRQEDAAQKVAQSQQSYDTIQNQYFKNREDYVTGKRNPISDIIKKPERDAAKDERLKQVAKWSFIGDAVGLIGKAFAASRGIKPSDAGGRATYQAVNELNRLDEVYRQEGYRYDHNVMLDSLRRQQSADELEKTRLGLAQNEFNYNRDKADQADLMAMNLDLAREHRSESLADQKEQRSYNESQADKSFNRQVALQNNRYTQSSNAQIQKKGSDSVRYTIQDINGNAMPVTKDMETFILSEARKLGVSANTNKEVSILMSDPSNSPEARAEVQRLYNEINKKKGSTDIPAVNAAANALGKVLKNRGLSQVSVATIRDADSKTNNTFGSMSDNEIIRVFKSQGIHVITAQ